MLVSKTFVSTRNLNPCPEATSFASDLNRRSAHYLPNLYPNDERFSQLMHAMCQAQLALKRGRKIKLSSLVGDPAIVVARRRILPEHRLLIVINRVLSLLKRPFFQYNILIFKVQFSIKLSNAKSIKNSLKLNTEINWEIKSKLLFFHA